MLNIMDKEVVTFTHLDYDKSNLTVLVNCRPFASYMFLY